MTVLFGAQVFRPGYDDGELVALAGTVVALGHRGTGEVRVRWDDDNSVTWESEQQLQQWAAQLEGNE